VSQVVQQNADVLFQQFHVYEAFGNAVDARRKHVQEAAIFLTALCPVQFLVGNAGDMTALGLIEEGHVRMKGSIANKEHSKKSISFMYL
jgi:hypothetical protein